MKRQMGRKIMVFIIMFAALVVGMMLTANAQSEEFDDYYLKYDGDATIYAEGHPVTIKMVNGKQYIYSDESGKRLAAKYKSYNGAETIITEMPVNCRIYGGSDSKVVENTSVTLDGVKVLCVFGGGKGSKGGVNGTSKVYAVNSSASKYIVGGGYKSNCGNVDITVIGSSNSFKVAAGLYIAGYQCNVSGSVRAYIGNARATGTYGASRDYGSIDGNLDVTLYNLTGTAFYAGGENGNINGKVTVNMRECKYDYMSIGPKVSGTVKEAEVDVYKCSSVIYCGLYEAGGNGGTEKVTLRTGHTLNIYVSNGTVGTLNVYCVKEESRDSIYVPSGCETQINFNVFKSYSCSFDAEGVPKEIQVTKDTVLGRENNLPKIKKLSTGKTINVKWIYLCKYVNGVRTEQYMPMSATWDSMITVASTDRIMITVTRSDKNIVDINNNIFANGIPIVIDEIIYTTYIFEESGMLPLSFVDENGKVTKSRLNYFSAVYGGSSDPNSVLTETSVTMLGGYVKAIFGGGNGDITGTANVTIESGRVNVVQGGGFGIGKVTNKAVITVNGAGDEYIPEDDFDTSIKRINGGGYSGTTNIAEIYYNAGDAMVIFGGGYLDTAATGESSIYLNGGKINSVYAGGFAKDCITDDANIEVSGRCVVSGKISGGATLNLSNSGLTGEVTNGGTITLPSAMRSRLVFASGNAEKYEVTEK